MWCATYKHLNKLTLLDLLNIKSLPMFKRKYMVLSVFFRVRLIISLCWQYKYKAIVYLYLKLQWFGNIKVFEHMVTWIAILAFGGLLWIALDDANGELIGTWLGTSKQHLFNVRCYRCVNIQSLKSKSVARLNFQEVN